MKQRKELYNQLHDIMSNFGDKNVKLIMGDFNAKIGSDNQGYDNVMGCKGSVSWTTMGSCLLLHVLQIVLWLEEVYSLTREYPRQRGYHLTKSLNIR